MLLNAPCRARQFGRALRYQYRRARRVGRALPVPEWRGVLASPSPPLRVGTALWHRTCCAGRLLWESLPLISAGAHAAAGNSGRLTPTRDRTEGALTSIQFGRARLRSADFARRKDRTRPTPILTEFDGG